MDKEFIIKKAEFMQRVLQIVYLNFDKKMEEITLQNNQCPKCRGINIQHPDNNPKSNIHSFGDSSNFFTCSGLVCWKAICLDCGTEIPIHSSYDYDIKRGFEVNSGDFFLDEDENYVHYLHR
ncbi:hypothetical protein K0U27_10625 [archaeon]|nr:hypothetical protein [archaeon]